MIPLNYKITDLSKKGCRGFRTGLLPPFLQHAAVLAAVPRACGLPRQHAVSRRPRKLPVVCSSRDQSADAAAAAASSPSAAGGPTAPTAGITGAGAAASTSSNGHSVGPEAGSSSSSTGSSTGSIKQGADYILFTADQLQQDAPVLPPTSSTDSSVSSSLSQPAADAAVAAKQTATASQQDSLQAQQWLPEPPQQPQQQPQQQQQQPPAASGLPTNLTVAVGPADEFGDPGLFGTAAEAAAVQQQVLVPPPLIDPAVDIANDPAYAIRLMDILDQIAGTASNGSSSSSGAPPDGLQEPAAAAPAAADQQQQAQQQQAPRYTRQLSAFCTNCCTPLDPARPSACCTTCGHFPGDDHLLFSQGVSSAAGLAAHSPPWLLQQQQQQQQGAAVARPGSAAAAVKAGLWRRQQQQQQEAQQQQQQHQQEEKGVVTEAQPQAQQQQTATDASSSGSSGGGGTPESSSSSSSSMGDVALTQQQAQAAGLLHQAQQQLQEARVLKLPKTLLAWEDESSLDGLEEAAMHLHRGLLPPNHERPDRLKVIEARLKAAGLMGCCERLSPRQATDDELLAVHTPGLLAAVAALSNANAPSDLNRVAAHLAPDQLGNRFTHRAARTAAGTAAELARRLVLGQADNGLALIRPLGHAAGVDTTEAGAYFNNAAVAVRAAQQAGARRVMVIDWDIHHCKGTEEIFAEDPNVLVLSLHRYGSSYYPGTGAATDIGVGRGRGRTINVAWTPPVVTDKRGRRVQVDAPPVSDGDFLTAWHMLVLPVVAEFRPELLLVSAGFDAVDKDPLGHYRVHPECFGHLTALLLPYAPVGLLLEGGYNLAATAACVESCLRVLLGERPVALRGTRYAGVTGWSSVLRTMLVHQEHWQSLGLLNFLQLASTAPAGPEEWGEDEEQMTAQEWEEGEMEGEEWQGMSGEDSLSDEQELPEEEFEQALATAASLSGQPEQQEQQARAPAAAAADVPAQLLQLLSAAQEDEALLRDLQQLLQRHKAAPAAAAADAYRQQREQRAAAAAAEAADAAAAAARARSSSSSSSSSSSGSERQKGDTWSAGGFLEDHTAVDSGSDDESYDVLGSTDWGWQQLDEENQDDLPFLGVTAVQQQLHRAEQEAAAAKAAAAAAAEAAVAAAAEAAAYGASSSSSTGGDKAAAAEGVPGVQEAIQEVAVAAVAAEATMAVAVEAAKEAEEAAEAAAALALAVAAAKAAATAAAAAHERGAETQTAAAADAGQHSHGSDDAAGSVGQAGGAGKE